MTSARRTHANRSEDRPHPGRRHGGQTKAVATGVENRTSSNKFLGRQAPVRTSWYKVSKAINAILAGRQK